MAEAPGHYCASYIGTTIQHDGKEPLADHQGVLHQPIGTAPARRANYRK